MNLCILVNTGTNKPDGNRTLSSESDKGALCLFKLMFPLFSSPASILKCKHSDITDWICVLRCGLLNSNL